MNNLESIVPPLELCKRIPAGEFEDSAVNENDVTAAALRLWFKINHCF